MKTIYQDYQVILSAGEFRSFQVHGNYFRILSNSATDNPLVSFDGQSEQPIPSGLSVELPDNTNFVTVNVRNPSAGSTTLRFCVSNGKVDDSRSEISGVVVVNASGDSLSTPVKYAAGTGAPVSAAVASDVLTRQVLIQNHGANAVWCGDSDVDGANTRGIKISPDETLVLESSADIYLRAVGAASDCSILKISKA